MSAQAALATSAFTKLPSLLQLKYAPTAFGYLVGIVAASLLFHWIGSRDFEFGSFALEVVMLWIGVMVVDAVWHFCRRRRQAIAEGAGAEATSDERSGPSAPRPSV